MAGRNKLAVVFHRGHIKMGGQRTAVAVKMNPLRLKDSSSHVQTCWQVYILTGAVVLCGHHEEG